MNFPTLLLTIALVILPIGCLVGWSGVWRKTRNGRPAIDFEIRDCVGWGLLDMAVYVVTVGALVGLGTSLAFRWADIEYDVDTSSLPPEDQAALFIAFGIAVLVATALLLCWNVSRFQRLDGFDNSTIARDLRLGAQWFAMLIVPIIALQFVLNLWYPTQHPLIELLRETGNVAFLPTAAFAAIVAAPLFEECFFRLFLQGWLEKMQLTSERTAMGLATKADRDAVLLGGITSGSLTGSFTNPPETSDSFDNSNAYAPPAQYGSDSSATESREPPTDRKVMWVPIVVSAGIFALAHLGHGPDWIPLFFLAVGLGYIYQRTGRILPTIVIHFLVNSLGILQLWAAIL